MLAAFHDVGAALMKLWPAPNILAILVGMLFELQRTLPQASEVRERTRLLLNTCLSVRAALLSELMRKYRDQELLEPQPLSRDPFIAYVSETDRYLDRQVALLRIRRAALRARSAVGWAVFGALAALLLAIWPSARGATALLGLAALTVQLVAFILVKGADRRLDDLEVDPDFKAVTKRD